MTSYDVIGIGNAIVDVISASSDMFLDQMGIEKGIMQLIERDRAEVLYAAMQNRVETPGGSVANTIAGLGGLGLHTAFIGKVKDDALGRFYAQGMQEAGTAFPNPPMAAAKDPTSRSMIFVSPDGERSMNTYLGAGADLGRDDVPTDIFAGSKLLFLEGYLFDKDDGKTAFSAASQSMHAAGGKSGISLSDPFCVERHRADFQKLITEEMDFVLGNEAEWMSLYQTETLEDALSKASDVCETIVCTREGSPVLLRRGAEAVEAQVTPITPVDATGAGDQFATGFLFGMAKGLPLLTCGQMGVIAAAEVIGHVGPRPQTDLATLFSKADLL
jgi:sugar/nucleoside kinase (ribokinase family)